MKIMGFGPNSKKVNSKVKIREMLKKGMSLEQIWSNHPYTKREIQDQINYLKNN